jgi:hypothetical protein
VAPAGFLDWPLSPAPASGSLVVGNRHPGGRGIAVVDRPLVPAAAWRNLGATEISVPRKTNCDSSPFPDCPFDHRAAISPIVAKLLLQA